MKVTVWPLEKIVPYTRNARQIPQRAVDKVAASIEEFGWRQPIVVDRNGVIVCGHVRWLAAKKLGLTKAPVHVAENLTPAQIQAFRLRDNRSHEETMWDKELLAIELLDLKDLGMDLSLTGFEMDEIDDLLGTGIEGLTDADAVPEIPEIPVSSPGDLWTLGPHRLLCGDATSESDVGRLMGGDLADLLFTDPPYNVDYEGYTEDRLKIEGDRMTDEQFENFLGKAFASLRRVVKSAASVYVCHASFWQRQFENALENAGFEVRCQIIWAKNTFAWGFGRYKFQHEPIFYCHVAGESDSWYGDKTQSTLWEENKPSANRLHPTMKPVELIERALVNSSRKGTLVVDLFAGSGSTLIACERTGRRASLIEIDPRYCDVIIRRWEQFSGKRAILDGSDRPFDAVAQERKQRSSHDAVCEVATP